MLKKEDSRRGKEEEAERKKQLRRQKIMKEKKEEETKLKLSFFGKMSETEWGRGIRKIIAFYKEKSDFSVTENIFCMISEWI